MLGPFCTAITIISSRLKSLYCNKILCYCWNICETTRENISFPLFQNVVFNLIQKHNYISFFAFAFLYPKVNVCLSFYILMPRSTEQQHCFLMVLLFFKYQKFHRPTIPCLFYLIKDLQRKRKIVRWIIKHGFSYRNYNFKLCSLPHEGYY